MPWIETKRDAVSEHIMRDHPERNWSFPKLRPVSDFQWTGQEGEIESSEMFRESRVPLDLVPSGTPHAPITISNNFDFLLYNFLNS